MREKTKHPVLIVAACSNEGPTTVEEIQVEPLSFHDHDIEITTPE